MNYDEFAFFNQQLAAMLREGIPLEGALKQLCAGMRSGPLRGEIQQLEADLARGTPLKEALARRAAAGPLPPDGRDRRPQQRFARRAHFAGGPLSPRQRPLDPAQRADGLSADCHPGFAGADAVRLADHSAAS